MVKPIQKNKPQPDQFDKAIAHLRRYPKQIQKAWTMPVGHPAGCLFMWVGGGGCLTQIRNGEAGPAQPRLRYLTGLIRKDRRIPKQPSRIRLKHLPVFAAWHRRIQNVMKTITGV